ncbi:hypothetical protein C0Q70_15640 [Pomacea canaliculata]|uniref:SOCS box domain-containing protein n=2 Tax=Pomacea canaliculata TaxID=400727 RepID=A0A2T7NVE9_POMCA|nr:ankyrin repeat and SOCS box protein 9-like isoform X2 [Pomacea canaliculata]XP_025106141.1 ankyrin repeat and SOCS box protein 9-like isoform X2 [Pomacea canaliculata]XP_025106142.1 ankyrin repeat and SOCS box protein 9-like isoform X2 [Pomacea canaliculata]XP_025106143.1 ankyrin repeat and SOCS box protein 9-like isoform X2 [Pomacea canaliculata]PVD25142.1 hypothetical protein C0Q70_15640 [Pomacea canaliculata]
MSSTPLRRPENADNADTQCKQQKLQQRIMKGDWKALQEMVNQGWAWNSLSSNNSSDSPLHMAIKQRDLETVKMLLTFKDMVKLTNHYMETGLHLACRMGLYDIALCLLEAGANINSLDCENCTPVFHAVSGGSLPCVELMINIGCDLDMLNNELITPMDQALLYNDHQIVAQLLRAGCCTEKLKGHIYYHEHCSNSFFSALWSSSSVKNMKLFLDCGYFVSASELKTLKDCCQQQLQEKEALALLTTLTSHPPSLLFACRVSVRRHLMAIRQARHTPMSTMISSLDIPLLFKDYLLLKEE